MTLQDCIERLEKIISNSCTYEYCEFEIQANEWKKGDKDRTYFAIVEKSANSKSSKHYVKKNMDITTTLLMNISQVKTI